MKAVLVVLISYFLSQSASAGGVFNSLVNNLTSGGHLCGQSMEQSYNDFSRNFSRSPEFIERKRSENKWMHLQMIEHHLHHDATLLYKKKTPCVSDFANRILETYPAIQEIRKITTMVWLNQRKAKLILQQCNFIEFEKSKLMMDGMGTGYRRNHNSQNYSVEKLVQRNQLIDPYFFQDCHRKETVAALRSLIAFSSKSLPFLSSQELIDIIQANRSMIISSKTQQPLKDEELLRLDLTGKTRSIRFSQPLAIKAEEEIIAYIRKKLGERESFSRELNPVMFDKKSFQVLYDEGIVDEALQSVGVTKESLKENRGMYRMMACLRTEYDKSLVGTTLDFVALFAVTRGLLGRLPGFNSMPIFLQQATTATLAAAGPLIDACMDKKNQSVDQLSGSSMIMFNGPNKFHLPNGLNIDLYELRTVPIGSIQACSETNQDHLSLQKKFISSCFEEALFNILPATLGLGVMTSMMADD